MWLSSATTVPARAHCSTQFPDWFALLRGRSSFLGKDIASSDSDQIVKLGISQAPEGRRVFPRSSVQENLEMGAYTRSGSREIQKDIEP